MKHKHIFIAVGLAVLLGAALPARAQGIITLHSFSNSPDGANPRQLAWANGFFYGATANGGSSGNGAIFRFNPGGPVFATIYNFTGAADNGISPNNLLVTNGMIYGSTKLGGTNTGGMIFAINTNGTGFNALYSFGTEADGHYPLAGLTLIGATLYGAASVGGINSGGTLFKINTNGTGYASLHLFTNNPDGSSPQSELVAGGGTLFGTTAYGGSNSNGVIFSIATNGANFTVLHNFTTAPDGKYPFGGLVLDSGILYGTTLLGGSNNNGTVFAVSTTGGNFRILHHFTRPVANTDGSLPKSSLTVSGGVIYGTASGGGSGNGGVVFQLNTDGTGFSVVNNFTYNPGDGNDLENGVVVLGTTIWGTTYSGGSSGDGILYSLSFAPGISQQPKDLTVASGSPAAFTNVASGAGPLSYQWYLNTNTPVGGGTNAILLIPNATTLQAGFYSVVVTNFYGSVTSSAARLTVTITATAPVITQQPQDLTVNSGQPAGFTNVATGTSPLFYQWYFNTNTPVSGATSAILNWPSVTTTQAGYYSVIVTNVAGQATSSPARLTVIDIGSVPIITQQPQQVTATNGDTVSFTNVATGAAPLHYQWYFNTNTILADETNSVLTLTAVVTNQAGYYSVIVTNGIGKATSSQARLTVASTRPIILSQPQNLAAGYGLTASFDVTAVGRSPLKYQWYSNNVAGQVYTAAHRLARQTNATLTFTALFTNVSYYSVIVTNSLGSATSSPAMLTVFRAPIISSNPVPASVLLGAPASFSVGVIGANILRYQWYFNTNTVLTNLLGTALAKATNSTLTFSAVSNSLVGSYTVIVTNTYGRATSSPVALTIETQVAGGQPGILNFAFDPASSSVSFTVTNTPASANRLWASPNLSDVNFWQVIASNVMAADGLWLFTDPNVGRTNNVRFYRASSP